VEFRFGATVAPTGVSAEERLEELAEGEFELVGEGLFFCRKWSAGEVAGGELLVGGVALGAGRRSLAI